jgi:hypothetical protein
MAQALTTRDIGLAIRDHLEDHDVFALNEDGERIGGGSDVVEFVECSDANNLTIHMLNGQRFAVRIVAI